MFLLEWLTALPADLRPTDAQRALVVRTTSWAKSGIPDIEYSNEHRHGDDEIENTQVRHDPIDEAGEQDAGCDSKPRKPLPLPSWATAPTEEAPGSA